MSCPDQETIERYILGQLEVVPQAEFDGHLEACSDCKAKVAEARANETFLEGLLASEMSSRPDLKHDHTGVGTVDRAQSLLGDRYRVIRKVGEGSAGQVFQAIDAVLERLVAIKFLRQNRRPGDSSAEPWHEARLMSQLNHPYIAQVYEIGELDGQRFIVMEWIDGLPVTEAWQAVPLQQRLQVYLKVLEGIAAAHRRGIVHRDIKPSNILVTSELKPKVLDFGIAIETSLLECIDQGVYRGTPAYSAPEQVTVPVKISTATDIYALGILLYELLTDTLPFQQATSSEIFESIKTECPEFPAGERQTIPVPLQNICLKALEKEARLRYQSAHSLADDINRYLRGEKVWSRPSFLMDKIQQEIFYHRQKLKVWRENELITQNEFDRLENTYDSMISPADTSIIEARKLSLSQVCLYLGGWIVVLGSFVLFHRQWEQVSTYLRPMPAIAAALVMTAFGIMMWYKGDRRLGLGFLATAGLLVPVTILLTLAQWEVLPPTTDPWGTESIAEALKEQGAYVITGNTQLYIASWCWLAFSLLSFRITRSSIFVLFGVVAFLVWLTICYIITGMLGSPDGALDPWSIETVAGRYLYPGLCLFAFGVLLDRSGRSHYAWPLCSVGLALIVLCLDGIAISEATLFGWLWRKPEALNQVELQMLSLACNGLLYLGLASICRSLGTRLQRTLASVLNWLGPLHILTTLRALDWYELEIPGSRLFLYRILLPVASLAFVFGSVSRQMKSFFFSGLAGIAAAIQRFTIEHFDTLFAWPVSLIVTGTAWMLISWLVPRWKASKALKRKR
jgi:serine/threonine protein kinase/multisubunit Na+/H+ antiporter MnhB subunit